MKKTLLVLCLFATLGFSRLSAQILNAGFENWIQDTAHFDGFSGFFPAEDFLYSDPAQWTTTNPISGADTLGHFFFINQTNVAHSGSSAIELTTDTLKTVGTPLGPRRLTIPGLALNGDFPLDLGSSLLAGGIVSPMAVPGAGQPWTKRLSAIKGFFSYAPVLKDTANNYMDSCMIWAILRKGDKQIAYAQFTTDTTTGGYQPFSANFTYTDCDAPDTLVILLAASVPNFGSILTGTTGLVAGSILRVDDLDFDTLAANFNYPPIARIDFDTTTKNVAKNVLVKANDDDCNDPLAGLTIAVTNQPVHGTAVAASPTHIVYTPSANYVGVDSFGYSLSDGVSTSTAKVKMVIFNSVGINEANQTPVVMYPVPATDELNIQFENSGKSTLRVFDMLGNLVYSTIMTKNINTVNVSTLANGIYGIQIANEQNTVIARSKFSVSK